MARIVVGVDGSDGAATALRWAVDEARLRGATLEVVLAWSYLDQKLPQGEAAVGFRPDYGEADAMAFLEEAVAAALAEAPTDDVDIALKAICDLPARALIEAGDGADLLVVGSRGRGGFRGLLLGAVGEQVVHHAPCPVVIVRSGPGEGRHDDRHA